MDTQSNKQVVRRYFDLLNSAKVDELDEVMVNEVKDHISYHQVPGQKPGLEGYKQTFSRALAGFPGLHYYILDEMIAEGDKVVVRFRATGIQKGEFLGVSPAGAKMDVTGIMIFRVDASKIIEFWGETDVYLLMQQLGAVKPISS